MKLVAFPYRWKTPRLAWKNITHIFWDLRNGMSNIPKFFAAVWWFRPWDWTGMVELLQVCAHEMRLSIEINTVKHVGWERDRQRLLAVEQLCKRLLADDYFDNAGHNNWDKLSDHEKHRAAQHASYMENQDAKYLGKMLTFVREWWN